MPKLKNTKTTLRLVKLIAPWYKRLWYWLRRKELTSNRGLFSCAPAITIETSQYIIMDTEKEDKLNSRFWIENDIGEGMSVTERAFNEMIHDYFTKNF